jgi:hypothetical protein
MDETHASHACVSSDICMYNDNAPEAGLLTFNCSSNLHIPHPIIIAGMNTLGRSRFNRMLVKGSKSEYEMKKIVKDALYCPLVIFKSSWRPSIFAFPILVLSRKEMRYRNESWKLLSDLAKHE